jgi:hypothetical protein
LSTITGFSAIMQIEYWRAQLAFTKKKKINTNPQNNKCERIDVKKVEIK